MTAILATDPTAAAVLDTMPCYPVPPSGASPAIDALRDARAGHGFAIGRDGMMLILRRPWLALDVIVTSDIAAYVPFGPVSAPKADLRCGLIPAALLEGVLRHFRAELPNEAAAFIIWCEATGGFAVELPAIDDATPSRLVYRPPALRHGWHLVCDIHSHGSGRAFFSATDDADDRHATKIALVFGALDGPEPDVAARICAAGMFLPLPRIPFAGGHDAA